MLKNLTDCAAPTGRYMKIRISLQNIFQSFVESLVFTYDATGDLQNCASGDFPFTSNTSKNFLEITAMEKNTSLQ